MRIRCNGCPMLLTAVGLLAGLCHWPAAAGQPASQPATEPAPASASLDPTVEKILDRLENKVVRDIEADLVFIKKDPILEDEQKFRGILRFVEAEPNPRFFIRFDEVVHEGIVQKKKEWHVFDGEWYIEAREKTATAIRRQIVYPGEKVEVFRIGKGPFPLPFGQKKNDIARHFSIKLIPPAPGDPKDTDHLECTPLPGTEMYEKYGKVHFYIDRKLDLPVRVQTVEKGEGNEITASFSNIRLNKGLERGQLVLPDLGYTTREERLPPPAPTTRPEGPR